MMMNLLEATLLGIVEGLTEFLPVSSTGHLILTSAALGLENTSGAFEVVIQAGAMLAVIWHYRELFFNSILGVLQKNSLAWKFWTQVGVAFLPAAVIGLTLGSFIKKHLFGVLPVAIALVVGGIVMIIVERRHPLRTTKTDSKNDEVPMLGSYQQALFIGFFQCFALWPGTSRSMATILGGRLLGLSPKKAAEFSFWLAVPTLMGASLYDAIKHRQELFHSSEQLTALIVGTLVSFLSGLFVIRLFINYLKKNSLEVFGWYRIVIGIVVAIYALTA